jgi:hypothetical protein
LKAQDAPYVVVSVIMINVPPPTPWVCDLADRAAASLPGEEQVELRLGDAVFFEPG